MAGGMAGLGLRLRMALDGIGHVAYEPNVSAWSGTFYVSDTGGRLPTDLMEEAEMWLRRHSVAGIAVSVRPYAERSPNAEDIDGRSNRSVDRIIRGEYWTAQAMQSALARRFPVLRWTYQQGPTGLGVVLTLDCRFASLVPEVRQFVQEIWPEWRVEVLVADASATMSEYRVTPPTQGIYAPAHWQPSTGRLVEQYARDADDWFDSTVARILDQGLPPDTIVPDIGKGTGQAAWLPAYSGVGLAETLALYDRVFLGLRPESPVLQEPASVLTLHRLAHQRRVIPVFLQPLARYPATVTVPFLHDHIPSVLPRQLDALVLAGAVRRDDLWVRLRRNPDEAQALLRAIHQTRLLRDNAPGMDQALAVIEGDMETLAEAAASLDENVWEKGWAGMLWGLPGSPLLHLMQAQGTSKTAWPGLMLALLDMAVGDSLGAVVVGDASAAWAKVVANVGYRGLQWAYARTTPRVESLSNAAEVLRGLQLAIPDGWALDEYATAFTSNRTLATRTAIRALMAHIDSDDRSGRLTALRIAVDRLNRDIWDADQSKGRSVQAVTRYLQPVSLLVGLGLASARVGNPLDAWLVNDAVNGALLAVASLVQDRKEDLLERVLEIFGVASGNPSRLIVLHETQQTLRRPPAPPELGISRSRH